MMGSAMAAQDKLRAAANWSDMQVMLTEYFKIDKVAVLADLRML